MLEQVIEGQESIINRREINAPPNYVSVFHETKTEKNKILMPHFFKP